MLFHVDLWALFRVINKLAASSLKCFGMVLLLGTFLYFSAYRSSPLKFGTTETGLSEMLLFKHSMSPESKEVNYGLCCTINVFYLFCNFQFHLERVEVFERFVNLLRIFNFQNVINFLFPLCKTYEMFWIFWQLQKVLSTPRSHGCVAGTECCTTAHCALWTLLDYCCLYFGV